ADRFEHARGRAFHGEITVLGKGLRLNERAFDALGIKPSLSLGPIAGCGAGERESRQPLRKLARKRTTDRAKAGNGNAGGMHDGISRARLKLLTPGYIWSQDWNRDRDSGLTVARGCRNTFCNPRRSPMLARVSAVIF